MTADGQTMRDEHGSWWRENGHERWKPLEESEPSLTVVVDPAPAAAGQPVAADRPADARREPPTEPEPPARPHLRDRLLTLGQLASKPPVRPLVEGLIYRNTIVQMAGAPGSYKSFLAVGIVCSVAAGFDFEGHRVREGGPVLYVAPEGSAGLTVRILAWCQSNGVPVEHVTRNLRVLDEPLLLNSTSEVDQAVEVARESGVILTVLDTRARCTSGLDENSSTEQDVAIRAAERIQKASGGSVLGVHHTGRNGKHGRGSNAWDGAVWSDLQIEGAGLRARIHCEKHKDVPDGCDHPFRMLPWVVTEDLMPRLDDENADEWLRRRSTLVAVQGTHLDTGPEQSGNNARLLDIAKTSAGLEGLSRAQLVTLATDGGMSRAGAYAAAKSLVQQHILRNVGTEKSPRYVPTGQQMPLPEED